MIRWQRFRVCVSVLVLAAASLAQAQDPLVLHVWPDGPPGAVGTQEDDIPTLTVFLPEKEKSTGTAIVICPGGAYSHVAIEKEGLPAAKWCRSLGIVGCVLQYRHAPKYHHPIPLEDLQRAIRLVRSRAEDWDLKPDRIGVMGFSAGGHLASTAGTHFDGGNPQAKDLVDRESSRPDFMILCYPVISFTESFTHKGSRKNLLGTDPDAKLVESLSNEKQVTSKTPPTFIFHTNSDTGVPADNSVAFYTALRAAKVPAEMHIYELGPHGIGLASADPALRTWPDLCANWMRVHGWLPAAHTGEASATSQSSRGTTSRPAAELAIRIVAEKIPDNEDVIRSVDSRSRAGIAQHIRDLNEKGAPAERDGLAWYEDVTSGKPVTGITSTHEGKRYTLAYTSANESMSGKAGMVQSAWLGPDAMGRPSITLAFLPAAQSIITRLTRSHLGKPMGIFVDDRMVSIATIQSEIRNRAVISGSFTAEEGRKIIERISAGIPTSQP